jgi:hypothetical protein
MAPDDAPGREARLASLATFAGYHWIMLGAFASHAERRLGQAGLEAVWRGVRAYGRYRGQWLRERPEALVGPRDAVSLLAHWDTGEWVLAAERGELELQGTSRRLSLALPAAPGSDYAEAHECREWLRAYWPEFLLGFTEAYDERAGVEVADSPRWRVTWSFPHATERPLSASGDPLADPAHTLALTRRTVGVLGGLQMYVSRELVRRFDATGEEVVREAAYQFGAERGSAVREKHLAEGRPLTLASFMSGDGLQERDPAADVFVLSGEQHLSDGAWYADCTYCPLQEVWAHEGREGLSLAFLFDAPNHRGLFESYRPDVIVRWDAVKSRGDSVCKFRFTIPGLVTPDDPTPEEYDRRQAGRLGFAL